MYAGWVLATIGEEDEATKLLAEVFELSRTRYVTPQIPGMVYAALGDQDNAFAHLEQAIQDRSMIASALRGPRMDGIRSDPRFQRLFERMGLKP